MTRFAALSLPFASCLLLALALLLLSAQPAFAGFSEFLSGLARRDRVIQICVVVACLALFILLKKLSFAQQEDDHRG